MNWADEPATWKQLKYLRGVGYQPDHHLTKTEAAALISSFGGPPEKPASPPDPLDDPTKHEARCLRVTVKNTRLKIAESGPAEIAQLNEDLARAVARRQEFWVDTCSDAGKMLIGSMQVQALYQKYGCRFATPSPSDVQYILDALDSAAPDWDVDHQELFYQTLELNFPHLLRRV